MITDLLCYPILVLAGTYYGVLGWLTGHDDGSIENVVASLDPVHLRLAEAFGFDED